MRACVRGCGGGVQKIEKGRAKVREKVIARVRERKEGERHTVKNERQKEKTETDRQTPRDRDRHTDGETERERDRAPASKRERKRESECQRDREGERAKKYVLSTYYATKCTKCCMELNIIPKVSPRLPAISSTTTSHSIKQWDIHNTQPNHTFTQSLYL